MGNSINNVLDDEQARQLLHAAWATARHLYQANVAVAVVRYDFTLACSKHPLGVGITCGSTAINQARTAVWSRHDTRDLELADTGRWLDHDVSEALLSTSLSAPVGAGIVLLRSSQMVGAIGVSGSGLPIVECHRVGHVAGLALGLRAPTPEDNDSALADLLRVWPFTLPE
jgi:uncharacterized protein GlcG (DUF336 family)